MRGVLTAMAVAAASTVAVARASEVRVGSKAFTESIVLGELATQLARSAGAAAVHRRALGGTRVLWEALQRGDVDVYPDYTGTLAREILAKVAPFGADALRAALAARGIAITGSLGFEDNYAIGVRREVADRLGLARISDLVRHPGLRLGFTNEFMDRTAGRTSCCSRTTGRRSPRTTRCSCIAPTSPAGRRRPSPRCGGWRGASPPHGWPS